MITYVCRNCDLFMKNTNRIKQERRSIFDPKLHMTINKKLSKKPNDVNTNTSRSDDKNDNEDSLPAEATYSNNTKLTEKFFGNQKRVLFQFIKR